MIQNGQANVISNNLIGTYCEASDHWYGKYRGVIIGAHKSYGDPSLNVRIVECLSPPKTAPEYCTVGNPLNLYVDRQEYKPGEIHHFYTKDVIPLLEEG